MAIIALALLLRLDWIVTTVLYTYGLRFSYDWANPYWLTLRSTMICLGAIGAVALILPLVSWKALHNHTAEIGHWKTKGFFDYKKNILALAFFVSAAILGVASVVLDSVPLIFAALGLAIWGAMLLLLTTQKVVKVNLAGLHLANLTIAFDSLLSRFGYDVKATIHPPMTMGDNPSLQIFEKARAKKISLTPLGLDFVFQIEKKSTVDLFSLEFDILSEFLSKMFTDEFELANGFAMSRNDDLIHVKMTDFIFQDLCRQIENISPSSCKRLLCPFCSSLACIISKATHKSVDFDKQVLNSKTIEIFFSTHEPFV